jgi:hypothetical protein
MTEKIDLRRAKVLLLNLAQDLELADMPTEADVIRCLARGPTFSEKPPSVPNAVTHYGVIYAPVWDFQLCDTQGGT